jgi:hypothetical protein
VGGAGAVGGADWVDGRPENNGAQERGGRAGARDAGTALFFIPPPTLPQPPPRPLPPKTTAAGYVVGFTPPPAPAVPLFASAPLDGNGGAPSSLVTLATQGGVDATGTGGGGGGLSGGAIAGVVVGAVAGVALLAAVALLAVRKGRWRPTSGPPQPQPDDLEGRGGAWPSLVSAPIPEEGGCAARQVAGPAAHVLMQQAAPSLPAHSQRPSPHLSTTGVNVEHGCRCVVNQWMCPQPTLGTAHVAAGWVAGWSVGSGRQRRAQVNKAAG